MILLTFDDCHIAEWWALIPWMKANAVRATFYVSDQDKIMPENWSRLHELELAGNSIQFHGLNHLNVRKVATWPEYLGKEIGEGLRIMKHHDFTPRHFAYPYGQYTPESHAVLDGFFQSLRTLYGGPYPGPRLPRVFGAQEFETGKTDAVLLTAESAGQILPLAMHKPNMERLERLLAYAREFGERFVTVDDIEWETEA